MLSLFLLLNVAAARAAECAVQLTVVGEVHDFQNDDRRVQQFRQSQYARAATGDLILGLEGVATETTPLTKFLLSRMIPGFSPEHSTVYGIESEFAYVFVGLLRARLQTSSKRLEISAGGLTSTTVGRVALRMIPNGVAGVLNLMKPNPVAPHEFLEEAIQAFLNLSQSAPYAAVIEDYPELAERVRAALSATDPDPELHRIAREWRDALFAPKILELYQLGRQKKKDVLIIVGSAHVPGILLRLRAAHLDPRVVVQNEKYGDFIEVSSGNPN